MTANGQYNVNTNVDPVHNSYHDGKWSIRRQNKRWIQYITVIMTANDQYVANTNVGSST